MLAQYLHLAVELLGAVSVLATALSIVPFIKGRAKTFLEAAGVDTGKAKDALSRFDAQK
jgi:hypothetical protein